MENLPNIAEDNNMDAERADTLDSQPDEVSDQEPDLVLVGTFRVPRLPQPDPEQAPAVWPAEVPVTLSALTLSLTRNKRHWCGLERFL